MKKTVGILVCLCILYLLIPSCNDKNQAVSMEKFEQHVSNYKNKIQNINISLTINEAIHIAQNGDHIVVYSIETAAGVCFGATLTVISPKKATLLIEFNNAEENWTTDNIDFFTSLISELTNYGLQFDETKTAVEAILKSDNYKFNRKACLFWDDYHSTLYYTETFQINDIP